MITDRIIWAVCSGVPLALGLALLRRWGLDRPCDTDVVPDAPKPTYSDSGRVLGDWWVRVTYDSVRDDLIVSWQASATPWRRSSRGEKRYSGEDIERALAEAEYQGRRLGVRRLF